MSEKSVYTHPLAAAASERLARIRESAAEAGLDALVCCHPDNVYYLSGFRTTIHTRFMAAVLPVKESQLASLVIPAVEERLARENIWSPSWLEDIRPFQGGSNPRKGAPVDPAELLQDLCSGFRSIGADTDHMTHQAYKILLRSITVKEPVNFSSSLLRLRMNKSHEERQQMEAACALAVSGAVRIEELLAPGVTELELARTIETEALAGGADGFAYPTLISFGEKSLAAHSPPMNRPLKKGQIVTLAFGPQVNGYSSDLVRTYYFGDPPREVMERSEQAVEAQEATLDAVAPGMKGGDLMHKALSCFKKHFPDISKNGSAGHGLGLSVHETPVLSQSDTTVLEPGMVLAIEPAAPAFFMENHGRYRHCDVVEVATGGKRLLTNHPRGLLVVD